MLYQIWFGKVREVYLCNIHEINVSIWKIRTMLFDARIKFEEKLHYAKRAKRTQDKIGDALRKHLKHSLNTQNTIQPPNPGRRNHTQPI